MFYRLMHGFLQAHQTIFYHFIYTEYVRSLKAQITPQGGQLPEKDYMLKVNYKSRHN